MFNPENQYRCTIIRGKAQTDLDNLLPLYAEFVIENCPLEKEEFNNQFNDYMAEFLFKKKFDNLESRYKKTIRNHITEIAGKLFGLYKEKESIVYSTDSCSKLHDDLDQPAFFKNLCFNFQFPNGTQKIQTIIERIDNQIKIKPFHFLIQLLNIAIEERIIITQDEIAYYVLNAKEVLQGNVSPTEVLNVIKYRRDKNILKRLQPSSKNTQHIKEQLNLLELSNLVYRDGQNIYLNKYEINSLNLFLNSSYVDLDFDIYSYDLFDSRQRELMYESWQEYFGQIQGDNAETFITSVAALQKKVASPSPAFKTLPVKGLAVNHNILGDEGEEFVFEFEKKRVGAFDQRLVSRIQMLGNTRGIGYDIRSVEADENVAEPEYSRYIEVKSTKRTTVPPLNDDNWMDTVNLTRREWIAAKQHQNAYNVYRVYFTPKSTTIRKLNNPYQKFEDKLLQVKATNYRMEFKNSAIDKEY